MANTGSKNLPINCGPFSVKTRVEVPNDTIQSSVNDANCDAVALDVGTALANFEYQSIMVSTK